MRVLSDASSSQRSLASMHVRKEKCGQGEQSVVRAVYSTVPDSASSRRSLAAIRSAVRRYASAM